MKITSRSLWITNALLLAALLSLGADECGPKPTTAIYREQRKVPFFKILVFEHLKNETGAVTQVWVFEDDAGNCYITSGQDGGVSVIPQSACAKAKAPELEKK